MSKQSHVLAQDSIYNKLARFIPDALQPDNSRYDTFLRMLRDKDDHTVLAKNFSFLWKVMIILQQHSGEINDTTHHDLIKLILSFDGKAPQPVLKAWCVLLFSLTQVSATWVPPCLQALFRILNGPYASYLFDKQQKLIANENAANGMTDYDSPHDNNSLTLSSMNNDIKTSYADNLHTSQETIYENLKELSKENDITFVDLETLQTIALSAIMQILIAFPLSASHVQKAFLQFNPPASAPLGQHCLWVHNALRLCENSPILRDACFSAIVEKIFQLDISSSPFFSSQLAILQHNYVPSEELSFYNSDDEIDENIDESENNNNNNNGKKKVKKISTNIAENVSTFKTIEWLLRMLAQYLYLVSQNSEDDIDYSTTHDYQTKQSQFGKSPQLSLHRASSSTPSSSSLSHNPSFHNNYSSDHSIDEEEDEKDEKIIISPNSNTSLADQLSARQAQLKTTLLSSSSSSSSSSQKGSSSPTHHNAHDDGLLTESDDVFDPNSIIIPPELQSENSESSHLLSMINESTRKKQKHSSQQQQHQQQQQASSSAQYSPQELSNELRLNTEDIGELSNNPSDTLYNEATTPFSAEFSGLLQATRAGGQNLSLLSELKIEDAAIPVNSKSKQDNNNNNINQSIKPETSSSSSSSTVLSNTKSSSNRLSLHQNASSNQLSSPGLNSIIVLSDKLCESIIRSFHRIILPAEKTFFVQWLLFYHCSFRFEYVEVVLRLLLDRIRTPNISDPLCISCLLYISSFVIRARYVRTSTAVTTLSLLARFAHKYLERYTETPANSSSSSSSSSSSRRSILHRNSINGKNTSRKSMSHLLLQSLTDPQATTSSSLSSSSYASPANNNAILSPAQHPVFYYAIETLMYISVLRPDLVESVEPLRVASDGVSNLTTKQSIVYSNAAAKRLSMVSTGPFVAQNGRSPTQQYSTDGAFDQSPGLSPLLTNAPSPHGMNANRFSLNPSAAAAAMAAAATTSNLSNNGIPVLNESEKPLHLDPLAIRRLLLSPFRPAQMLSPMLLEKYLISFHGCTNILSLQPPPELSSLTPTNTYTRQSFYPQRQDTSATPRKKNGLNNSNSATIYKIEPSIELLNLPRVFIPSIHQNLQLRTCLNPNQLSITETEQLIHRLPIDQRIIFQIFLKQQQIIATTYGVHVSPLIVDWNLNNLIQKQLEIEQTSGKTILRFETKTIQHHNNYYQSSLLSGNHNRPLTEQIVDFVTLHDLVRVGIFPQLHIKSPLINHAIHHSMPPSDSYTSAQLQQKIRENNNIEQNDNSNSNNNNNTMLSTSYKLPSREDILKALPPAAVLHRNQKTYEHFFLLINIQLSFVKFPFDPYYPPALRSYIQDQYQLTFDRYQSRYLYQQPVLLQSYVSLQFSSCPQSLLSTTSYDPPQTYSQDTFTLMSHLNNSNNNNIINNNNNNNNNSNIHTGMNTSMNPFQLQSFPSGNSFIPPLPLQPLQQLQQPQIFTDTNLLNPSQLQHQQQQLQLQLQQNSFQQQQLQLQQIQLQQQQQQQQQFQLLSAPTTALSPSFAPLQSTINVSTLYLAESSSQNVLNNTPASADDYYQSAIPSIESTNSTTADDLAKRKHRRKSRKEDDSGFKTPKHENKSKKDKTHRSKVPEQQTQDVIVKATPKPVHTPKHSSKSNNSNSIQKSNDSIVDIEDDDLFDDVSPQNITTTSQHSKSNKLATPSPANGTTKTKTPKNKKHKNDKSNDRRSLSQNKNDKSSSNSNSNSNNSNESIESLDFPLLSIPPSITPSIDMVQALAPPPINILSREEQMHDSSKDLTPFKPPLKKHKAQHYPQEFTKKGTTSSNPTSVNHNNIFALNKSHKKNSKKPNPNQLVQLSSNK